MKNILHFIFLLLVTTTFSQSIVVVNYNGDTLNSKTYLAQGDGIGIDTAKLVTYMSQDISEDKEVTVTKYNLNKCEGTKNFFCWQVCYSEAITEMSPFLSPDKITMSPGTSDSSFSAYHMPEGETGNAKYRFVWKVKGETDTTFVDVEFKINGICETQSIKDNIAINFDIYPNPIKNELTITTSNVSAYKIEVVNILGEKVIHKTMVDKHSKINTSSLQNGIYFVRFFNNGDIIEVKKIVVSK